MTWQNCTACGRLRSAIVPGDGRCLVCFNLDRRAVEQAKFYEERQQQEPEAVKPPQLRRAERRAAASAQARAVVPEAVESVEPVEPGPEPEAGAVEPVKVRWYRRWRRG